VLPATSKEKDERAYVELMSSRYKNIQLNFVKIPENMGTFSNWQRNFYKAEGITAPFGFATMEMYEQIHKAKVALIFTGQGGDNTVSYAGKNIFYEEILSTNLYNMLKMLCSKDVMSNGLTFKGLVYNFIIENKPYNKFYFTAKNILKPYDGIKLTKEYIRKINSKSRLGHNSFNPKKGIINSINSGNLGFSGLNGVTKIAADYGIWFSTPFFNKKMIEFF